MVGGERARSGFFERNGDNDAAHHVILFEVPLRTVRVRVMAADAGLRYSPVRINRPEVPCPSARDDPGIRAPLIHLDILQSCALELVSRSVLLVDGPQADQPVSDPAARAGRQLGRFPEELSWQRERVGHAPILRGGDDALGLQPLHDVDRIKRPVRLDHGMHVVGHGRWRECDLIAGTLGA